MSVRTMARVWSESTRGGSELLMLLAIADFADDDGRAYPSVTTLATKCRMKPRNANYVLAALVASGELKIRKNEGPHGTNRYVIPSPLQQIAPLQRSAPLQRTARTPATQCAEPLQPVAPEPSVNHQEPKTTRTRRASSASDRASLLPEVDAQVLADWQQVRKDKRAGPITATVVKRLRAEAEKAGMSVQQAVEMSCGRGWQSFMASWVGEKDRAAFEDPFAGCI